MVELLLAAREHSGRGADIYDPEDFVPLSKLIETFPNKLMFIPVALIALGIAYLLFSKRDSIPMNKPWYGIYNEDNGWQKAVLIICWIAFVIGLFPAAWTAMDILWRVIIGGTLTFISWLFQIILSIIVLLIFIVLIPFILYVNLSQKNKVYAYLVGGISLVGSITTVVYYWHSIISWSFMFPPLTFDL